MGGSSCPTDGGLYGNTCCCGAACCWDNCRWSSPPTNCLQGVPNSKWIWNSNRDWYQAFQATEGTMYNLFNPLIHKGKSPLKLFGLDRNTNRQPDSAIETRTVHNDFFELVSYIAILHQMHNGVRSKGDPETGCF